jgi:hypothetical protein
MKSNESLWSVEITINQDRVFGFYSDGNILVKDEAASLATVRERLSEALASLDKFAESPRAIGQTVS